MIKIDRVHYYIRLNITDNRYMCGLLFARLFLIKYTKILTESYD
jgi:hypothetical protein